MKRTLNMLKWSFDFFMCKQRQTTFRLMTGALPVLCVLYCINLLNSFTQVQNCPTFCKNEMGVQHIYVLRGRGGGLAVYVESEYLFPIFCGRQYLFLSYFSTDHLCTDCHTKHIAMPHGLWPSNWIKAWHSRPINWIKA